MSYSAFFYGTLLHPNVLKRVIGHDGSNLTICPAVLLNHTRHHVKNADYPAVLPLQKGRDLLNRELTREEESVRGNLVNGLSKADIDLLDCFEGNEYSREKVSVYPLGAFESFNNPLQSVIALDVPQFPASKDLGNPVDTEVYIWVAPSSQLAPELWSYETFISDFAWKWVGAGKDDSAHFVEVDRRRGMNGIITRKADDADDAVVNKIID